MNALDSLIDDFVARLRRGDEPDVETYAREHPDLAAEIREVFPALQLLEGVGVVNAESPTPAPRQLGEYVIIREVGRGGMGVVYEAVQQSLGRHVALKVLPPGLNTRPDHFERFRREARAVAGLHHTNIVPVFGVGEQDGVHFYAMQFIRGQTLAAVIAELQGQRGEKASAAATTVLHAGMHDAGDFTVGTPPADVSTNHWSAIAIGFFRSVARLGAQAADALDYAHRRGIVHRDVKPSNLLLDAAGTLWVTDFGLAKASESEDLTATGDILGTLAYMAPEQLEGKADARTDVYGLGLAIYEFATLTPAFRDDVRVRLIDKVRRGGPPAPRTIEPRIPLDLQTIIQKAIAPIPADRYPTAAAMAEDLRRFVAGRAILARRTTWAGQTWRWCKRNPAVASLLTIVVGLLIVVAVGGSVSAVINERESRAALMAEAEAKDRAWRAQLSEARAITTSGRLGQRFEAIRVFQAALESARERGPLAPADESEFRNVAVAALTLPDAEHAGLDTDLIRGLPLFYSGTLDDDGTVHIHKHGDTPATVSLPHPKQRVAFALDASSGRVAVRTLGADGGIRVWDASASPPREIARFAGEYLGRPVLSSDGRWVACAIDRASICIFDVRDGKTSTVEVGDGPDAQYALAFSPDGALTYPRFERRMFKLRRWRGGLSEDLPIPPIEGDVKSLAWDAAGRMLAIADDSRSVRVWDVSRGGEIGTRREHATRNLTIEMSPRGTHLLTFDPANILRIWEVCSGRLLVSTTVGSGTMLPLWEQQVIVFVRAGAIAEAIHFNPGKELVQCVHIHNGVTWGVGVHGAWFSPTDGLVATPLINPANSRLASGALLVDPATGLPLESIHHVPQHPTGFLGDGSLILSGFKGVTVWPRRKVDDKAVFGPPELRIPRRAIEDDGTSWRGTMAVFPKTNSKGEFRLVRPQQVDEIVAPGFDEAGAFEISPDGKWIAIGNGARTSGQNLRVLNSSDLSEAAKLEIDGPISLGFSPDGEWLWAGSESARLWHVGDWRASPIVGGRRMAIDATSRLAATDVGNGCVRVLDLLTGGELVRLQTPDREPLLPLSFSPDGRRLTAVSLTSRRLLIWDLRTIHQGLIPFGLQWTPEPKAESHAASSIELDEGLYRDSFLGWRALAQHQDLAPAAGHFKKAMVNHPDDHDTAMRLAQICVFGPPELRDLKLAEELCERAISVISKLTPGERLFAPARSNFQVLRAAVEYRHDRFESALKWLDKVGANPPATFGSYQLVKAVTLHRLGRDKEAKPFFERCDERLYWRSTNDHWLGILYRNLREEPGNPPPILRR